MSGNQKSKICREIFLQNEGFLALSVVLLGKNSATIFFQQ